MLSNNQKKICDLMGINYHQFIELNAENLGDLAKQAAQEKLDEQDRIQAAEQALMKLMKISPAEFKHIKEKQEACKLTIEEIETCEKTGILPVDYLAEKMKAAGVFKHPSGMMEIK